MSRRDEARKWAKEQVFQGIRALGDLVNGELQRRHAQPCEQALFHKRMGESLRDDRPFLWKARAAFHRGQLRRWASFCYADEKSANGRAVCLLSKNLGVDKPT